MVSCIRIVIKLWLFCSVGLLSAQPKVRVDTILMGSRFAFTVYDADTALAHRGIQAGIQEVSRIENLLSDWRPHTPVSRINRSYPNNWVSVDAELKSLLNRAKIYAEISGGLFDITYAGMDRIWKFDGTMERLPTQQQLVQARQGVGIQFLEIQGDSARLTHPRAKISFGSIGKAYAAEKAARVMQNLGLKTILVDGSGDLFAYGHPPGKKAWEIGLQNPFKPSGVLEKVKLRKGALLTSGDYEKFVVLEGRRYGHIINPKTGWPGTEFVSVTVQGPNAETANFLSTTLMLMPVKQARHFVKKYPRYRFWLVQPNGKIIKIKPPH